MTGMPAGARAASPNCGSARRFASGRLIFGAVGDDSRLEYTVIGDAVNLAAKLEKATKDQKVRAHTTRETYETALAQGYTPPDTKDRRAARRSTASTHRWIWWC